MAYHAQSGCAANLCAPPETSAIVCRKRSTSSIVPRQRQRRQPQSIVAGLLRCSHPTPISLFANSLVRGIILEFTWRHPAQDVLDKGRFRFSRTTSLDFKSGAPIAAPGTVHTSQTALPGLPGARHLTS